jgi:hypothetical protein
METVLHLHTSIAQCYLTRDQAVSLWPGLARKNVSVGIAHLSRGISHAHRTSVAKYKRWGVHFLSEYGIAELLGERVRNRRLSSPDVLMHDFACSPRDSRVAKVVELGLVDRENVLARSPGKSVYTSIFLKTPFPRLLQDFWQIGFIHVVLVSHRAR